MRNLLAGLALAGSALAAQAGDGAALDIIGFSPDARYFAYEQYGTNDGSAMPYSSIHVVDTATNTDAEGSPFRRGVGEDFDGDARAEARSRAREVLDRLQISRPATILGLNGLANPSEEILAMDIYPTKAREVTELSFWSSALGGQAALRVVERKDTGVGCKTMQPDRTVSVDVFLQHGESPEQKVFADEIEPKDLACPEVYGLVGVYRDDESSRFVAVLSVYGLGFEGPNRRFRAVSWAGPETP